MRRFRSDWLLGLVESAPSLIFSAFYRYGFGLETSGWLGSALAAIVLVGFPLTKTRYDTIMLGINIHLLMITPIIVALFHLGYTELGEILTRYSLRGVLVTVLIVGVILTFFSKAGFVAVDQGTTLEVRCYSIALVIITLVILALVFLYGGNDFLGSALPVLGLFFTRRLLASCAVAKLRPVPSDQSNSPSSSSSRR